jgi:hypothetical protein
MINKNRLHLECSCLSHALHIDKEESVENDPCPMWYVSIWLRGHSSKRWKYRWGQFWQILKTGEPYGDEVVLEKKDLLELQEYIKKQLEN